MELSNSLPLDEFRNLVRNWFRDKVPADWTTRMTGCSEEDYLSFQVEWFRKLVASGLATPHWPEEWGGTDLSIPHQMVIYEELARANAPRPILYFISMYQVPGTLLHWGTEEQKKRHLPAVLAGEIWCQGFSEPNAGSDLASVRTRAERRGDTFIINGQKVWSSQAHHADYCLLLARTDRDAPKHKGMSLFIMDMKSPGVLARPIMQSCGTSEFCELFLDNVEIPAENMIGPENQGWIVAQSTLSAERGMPIIELSQRMRRAYEWLVDLAKDNTLLDDSNTRRQLAEINADIEAVGLLVQRMLARMVAGENPTEEPSYIKIYYSELLRRLTELGVHLGGLDSQLDRPILLGTGEETGNWMYDYLKSWSWTIAGGSNEIIRTVVAERILGLPR